MDRRRAIAKRPASSEEVEYWSHASASLSMLSTLYAELGTSETIGKVNRLISAWPTDDNLPADGFDHVKGIYKKLTAGLTEVKAKSETELKAIENAIEGLSVLIALRKASEATPQPEKRKRPRGGSPATSSQPTTPATNTNNSRTMSTTVPARSSAGPAPWVPSRTPKAKARREALNRQLPLQVGRNVAFVQPVIGDVEPDSWILALITENSPIDKNRYVVQDPEPQENGQPGIYYETTLRSIIPLPDPAASPDSPTHLNAYQKFEPGATVMALYPDTSCFYRAEVIGGPSDTQATGRNSASSKHTPTYRLKFDDDDDQEHSVLAHWVVEWPGPQFLKSTVL